MIFGGTKRDKGLRETKKISKKNMFVLDGNGDSSQVVHLG